MMRALPWALVRMRAAGWRRAALLLAVLLLLGLLARDARQLWRAWRFNAAIAAQAVLPPDGQQATAPVSHLQPGWLLFVHAHGAAQAGRLQEALSLYKDAAADPGVAVAALYNSGNLYLRDALELAAQGALQQSPQSVELAKQQYRQVLRRVPDHWPARYNLERALWLAPELPQDETRPTPQNSERAVTTMRGFTIGLP
jgi:mxaK protein